MGETYGDYIENSCISLPVKPRRWSSANISKVGMSEILQSGGGSCRSCDFGDSFFVSGFLNLFLDDTSALFADCVVMVSCIFPIAEFAFGEDLTAFAAHLDTLLFVEGSLAAILGGTFVAPRLQTVLTTGAF